MKTAILIHGMPTREEYDNLKGKKMSELHFLPWLAKELEARGIATFRPEMPEPYEPDYMKWKEVFENYTVDEHTMLVGHSCGAGFLVRWLSENDIKVGRVVLVGPWIDPRKELTTGFFDFDIDPHFISKTKRFAMMYSTDDGDEVIESVNILKDRLPEAKLHIFHDKGHFTTEDMGGEVFPELLGIITE